MKKWTLIIGMSLMMVAWTSAQRVDVNPNVNLDKQPAWGPSGYVYAGFYYFPDLHVYYDVTNGWFYYLSGGSWASGRYLPDRFRKYDLYSMYKVVLNSPQPWLQNKMHRKKYASYKGDRTQEVIRYSHDGRYESCKRNKVNWVNSAPPNHHDGKRTIDDFGALNTSPPDHKPSGGNAPGGRK